MFSHYKQNYYISWIALQPDPTLLQRHGQKQNRIPSSYTTTKQKATHTKNISELISHNLPHVSLIQPNFKNYIQISFKAVTFQFSMFSLKEYLLTVFLEYVIQNVIVFLTLIDLHFCYFYFSCCLFLHFKNKQTPQHFSYILGIL